MKKSWTKNSHRVLMQATALDHYNRWIFSLFKKYLDGNILEVGSGLGGLSGLLPQKHTTLSDSQDDYFNYLKSRGYATLKLDIEKAVPDNLQNSYDTIFSSNVFEHIDKDDKAFMNCHKLLKKNGQLLLFVPAGPEIFGSLDRAMGHYRRYTKEELAKKAISAGFKIIKIKYTNFLGYFTWWFRGRLPANSNSDNLMAKIFDLLIVPFLYIEKFIPVPFGQSLMLVAEKP